MLTDPMLEENQGTFCINIDKDGKANVEKLTKHVMMRLVYKQ